MKKTFIVMIFLVHIAFFSNAKANEKPSPQVNNNFGINLYQTLSVEAGDKNVFISPYSIYSALAIAYAGSNANTKLEFEKSLDIKDPSNFHKMRATEKVLVYQRLMLYG
jgi:serine protease inhibitor